MFALFIKERLLISLTEFSLPLSSINTEYLTRWLLNQSVISIVISWSWNELSFSSDQMFTISQSISKSANSLLLVPLFVILTWSWHIIPYTLAISESYSLFYSYIDSSGCLLLRESRILLRVVISGWPWRPLSGVFIKYRWLLLLSKWKWRLTIPLSLVISYFGSIHIDLLCVHSPLLHLVWIDIRWRYISWISSLLSILFNELRNGRLWNILSIFSPFLLCILNCSIRWIMMSNGSNVLLFNHILLLWLLLLSLFIYIILILILILILFVIGNREWTDHCNYYTLKEKNIQLIVNRYINADESEWKY